GVGEPPGQVGEVAELVVEVAEGEQAGVGDDVGGVKGDGNGLPMEVGEGKVRGGAWGHRAQASAYRQVIVDSPLEIRARLLSPTPGAQSGLTALPSPWARATSAAWPSSQRRRATLPGRRSEEHTSELQSPYDLV